MVELVAALHPESVYFFYDAPKDRAYIQGFGTDQRAQGLQIPEGSALPVLLANSDQAFSVESLPTDGAPLMSWSWLYALRLDLIVPLNRADGSPVGFLLRCDGVAFECDRSGAAQLRIAGDLNP